jgi:hypothetical protein
MVADEGASMNRVEITRLAQEAGFVGMDGEHGGLRRFAALVASAEREACANLCIELAPSIKTMTAYKVLHEASKAIKSRGQE